MEEKENNKLIKAYKGFNKDMTCRDFKYEVGKEYKTDDAILCKKGFHACENPLDVLDFYSDVDGKYCVVEQPGKTETDGKKTVSSRIKIIAEVGFAGLFKLGIEWLKEITSPQKVDNKNDCYSAQIGSSGYSAQIGSSGYSAQIGSSGDYAKIGSSGDYAQIGSSGYYAKIGSSGDFAKIGSSGYSAKIGSSGYSAQIGSSGYSAQIGSSGDSAQIGSSGYYAKINSEGKDSVVCCTGNGSIVKAKKGSWITLSEWQYDENKRRAIPICVKTECVDGERIKEDVYYKLVDGKFVEVNL